MILFTILAVVLIFIALFLILMVSAIGAGGIIIFADVIVCAVIIGWIIGMLLKKR